MLVSQRTVAILRIEAAQVAEVFVINDRHESIELLYIVLQRCRGKQQLLELAESIGDATCL